MAQTDSNDGEIEKILAELQSKPEESKIPKPEKSKEQPKNDDFNEYEYSDDDNEDPTEW